MVRTTGIGVLVVVACMTLAVVGASAPGRADAPEPAWRVALPYVAARRPPSPAPSPGVPPTPPPAGVAILELRCRGRHELVRIRNGGSMAVDLTGWRLRSVVGAQQLALPDLHLEPGAELSVHSGPGADARPPGGILWTRGYVWNNGGDEALLRDKAGSNRAARACDDVAAARSKSACIAVPAPVRLPAMFSLPEHREAGRSRLLGGLKCTTDAPGYDRRSSQALPQSGRASRWERPWPWPRS